MNYTITNLNTGGDKAWFCHDWCVSRVPEGCITMKPLDYMAWFCILTGMALGVYDHKIVRIYGILFILLGVILFVAGWNV